MRKVIIAAFAVALAGCQAAKPVNRPCGVLVDSLIGVKATTPAGQDRLNIHYVRGRAAGCW